MGKVEAGCVFKASNIAAIECAPKTSHNPARAEHSKKTYEIHFASSGE